MQFSASLTIRINFDSDLHCSLDSRRQTCDNLLFQSSTISSFVFLKIFLQVIVLATDLKALEFINLESLRVPVTNFTTTITALEIMHRIDKNSPSNNMLEYTRPRRRPRPKWMGLSVTVATLVVVSASAFVPQKPTIVHTVSNRQSKQQSSQLFATTVVPPAPRNVWLPTAAHENKPLFDASFLQIQTAPKTQANHPLPKNEIEKWVQKYCTVAGLEESFGKNVNKFWGDYDVCSTRKLYKSLMPVALLELQQAGVPAQLLAPLAYKARVAAKLYARERCRVPGRIVACLLDGWRQFRKYGTFDTTGMSYQQIFDKYAELVLSETTADDVDPNDVIGKICSKIVERSCKSNEAVDRMFLREDHMDASTMKELEKIHEELERDVKHLCQHASEVVSDESLERQIAKYKALRSIALHRKRLTKLHEQHRLLSRKHQNII